MFACSERNMVVLKKKQQRQLLFDQSINPPPPPELASKLRWPVHPNPGALFTIFFVSLFKSVNHRINYELHQGDWIVRTTLPLKYFL